MNLHLWVCAPATFAPTSTLTHAPATFAPTSKYLVHRQVSTLYTEKMVHRTPEDECGENEMPKNEKFLKNRYVLHFRT